MLRLRSIAERQDLDVLAGQALGVLFAWGAVITLVLPLLPGRRHPLVSLVVAAAGFTAAFVLLRARHPSSAALSAFLLGGTACVVTTILTASTPSGADAIVFVWVGLFAGFCLGARGLALHLAMVLAAYAAVGALHPAAAGDGPSRLRAW